MFEQFLAPLLSLLSSFGPGLPVHAMQPVNRNVQNLFDAAHLGSRSGAEVSNSWRSNGAASAAHELSELITKSKGLAHGGEEITAIITIADHKIRKAFTELTQLAQTIIKAGTALGPTLFTPAGLASMLPLALSQSGKALKIITELQTELANEAHKLASLPAPSTQNAHPASAENKVIPSNSSPETLKGTAITLPDGSQVHAPNPQAATAVRAALNQIGTTYQWGGTKPGGFDCSGLTQWAYQQAGITIPRLAADQDNGALPISRNQLRPGDLAIWSGHVAMFIGNGQFVEAGDPVQISPVRTSNMGQLFEGFFRPTG